MLPLDAWSVLEEQLQREESEMEEELTKPDVSLWASVCETDPAFTKKFSRGGGFSGTATNATYLAKRATETFGPCGIGWGVEVENEEIMKGAPLLHSDEVIGHELIHKVRIKLWYVYKGRGGEVHHFGQTTFVGKNKNGIFTDEEAPKKSLTDAMSKALSLLGFASDVHLGLYDDNKYVNDLKEKFKPKPDEVEPDPDAKKKIESATTIQELQKIWISLTEEQRASCGAIKDQAKATLFKAQQNGTPPEKTASQPRTLEPQSG